MCSLKNSKALIHPVLVFLAVIHAFAHGIVFGQEPGQTLRLDVGLVLVSASVTDVESEFVPGLEPENFQVFEDRVEQDIVYFSTETAPASIGIIFDASNSMRRHIELAREAALTFIQSGTANDEYFLVEFGERAQLTQDFTTDAARLERRLWSIVPEGDTALYDAIYLALNTIRNGSNPRKALLLITDGEDNNSRYSRKDIRESLRESGILLYTIDLGRALAGDLAAITGGGSFRVSIEELREVCELIAAELKQQYVLGYVPSNTNRDGGWRQIRVHVNPPAQGGQINVRARQGYYAPMY